MRHFLWWAGLLLGLAVVGARAWEWQSATVDRDSLTLGDPLTLSLSVTAAPAEAVDWPLPRPEQLGGWRLLGADSLAEQTEGGTRTLTRRLRLARFRLGPAPLPTPGPLLDGQPAIGDTLRLEVLATLPDSAQPADILEPGRLRHGWRWWLLRAGALLVLGGLAVWAWRRWRRTARLEPGGPALPPDPWQDFLAELARIEERALWRAGQVESHYADLSLALRGLLEDCLGLPCRERSTDELRAVLRDSPLTDGDLQELLRLLDENDWVKYARQWPAAETCARQSGRYLGWAEARRELLLERHRQRQEAAARAESAPVQPARPRPRLRLGRKGRS
ncbi:MAG: hypothetical protein WC326_10195 [Candidatus Delongbacteria bacterium]